MRDLTIKEAALALQVSRPKLRKMIDDGELPYRKTKKGYVRIKYSDISDLIEPLPNLKIGLTVKYVRPKRIVRVKPELSRATQKGCQMLYQRNAKTALAMGAGLTHEYRGILSMLIDLMALHDNGGIPADTAYIAGNLNIGSRKWNQSVLPTLLNAQKIKKVKRGGIDVYIWAHPEWITGPKRVIQFDDEASAVLNSNEVSGLREDIAEETRDVTGIRRGIDKTDPSNFYNLKPAPPAEIVAPPPPDPAPKPEPQPDIAPAVSAMDVLERAGIDVSNHPRGDLFWARVEHNVTLEKWLETIPLNEIVARLARAQQQGLIDDHVNSLASYDQYVLEEG